jgi:hypothetical protein
MRIHVSVSGHARKLHNTCTHLHQNPKSLSSRTSIVYTFSRIQSAAVSLFVFISTQTNVYTLLCIRIKSCYSVVLYLLWNLCNNHPFLGDTVVLQVQHVCNILSAFKDEISDNLPVLCLTRQLTLRNVEWQLQKSGLSQPRNVYIICPKHQIL